MTTINVSNAAQLQSALASAKGGDTISLAAGNYGSVGLNNNYASDVTITSQNAGSPAIFNSLTVVDSSHLKFDGIEVKFTPVATTYSFSSAVEFRNSSDITFTHSTVIGGVAVSGIKQDGSGTEYYGNVQGLPTGYGININNSSGVKVDGVEVSSFYKGVFLNNSSNVTVAHSDVHDTRTTPIVVGGGSNITIDSNHLHDVNPYNFGATGDHADYLAMWTIDGQSAASNNIKITNNLMEQGKGQAVLGMWMQGGDAGYTNVQISGNAILAGNFQGIVLSEVTGGVVDHNTLLQTSGSTFDTAPSILLAVGSEKISVHDNIASAYNDQSGSKGALANSASNNTIVQKFDASKAGFYTNDLIAKSEASHTIAGLFGYTSTAILTPSSSIITTPIITVPIITAPIVTAPVVTPPAVTAPVITAPVSAPTTDTAKVDTGQVLNGSWDWTKMVGGSGNDIFNSKTTGDTLVGGAGDDTYNLIGGSKTLVVEAIGGGTDTVISKGDYTLGDNVENLTLAPAGDNWSGTGNSLNNVIKGNAGANGLDGGAGNDTIDGGAGNDYITGGAGNDLLIGGAGKDTFRFGPGSGRDTISDFSKTDHDAIDITAFMKTGAKVILTDVGTDVQISFGGSADVITLTGVHAKDLVSTFYGFTA